MEKVVQRKALNDLIFLSDPSWDHEVCRGLAFRLSSAPFRLECRQDIRNMQELLGIAS